MRKNRPLHKIVGIILLPLLSVLLLISIEKIFWKQVILENCGTIQIPSTWIVADDNGNKVIYDKDGCPVLVQFVYTKKIPSESDSVGSGLIYEVQSIQSGIQTSGVISVDSSTVYSNSSLLGEAHYTFDDTTEIVNYIEFWNCNSNNRSSDFCFIASKEVSMHILKLIALSFQHS